MPLLFSFGVVDVELPLGELDDDAPVDGDALDDEPVSEDAGGVAELDDDAPGVVDDELDDDPLVLGGVVLDDDDVDGDGVTTGGVVFDVVDDSRLQPAMPSTSPVQSSVTNALFIAISR
ncbi:MAG TPA: hypothetical protein VLN42_08800 [Casimicrobiaceae bacterium]|nr:hypothetical protein [Casimicrobiaceae bacterium]